MGYALKISSIVIALVLAGPALRARPEWKAGVAKIQITPRKPIWMQGFSARTKPSEGTLLDLYARPNAAPAWAFTPRPGDSRSSFEQLPSGRREQERQRRRGASAHRPAPTDLWADGFWPEPESS